MSRWNSIVGRAGQGLLVCALSANAFADRVTLHSGRQIVGTVEADGPAQVTIRTPAGLLSFEKGLVARIERLSKEANERAAITSYLQKGDLDSALVLLRKQVREEQGIDALLPHAEPLLKNASRHLNSSSEWLLRAADSSSSSSRHLQFAFRYLVARKQIENGLRLLVRINPNELTSEQRRELVDAIAEGGEWLVQSAEHELTPRVLAMLCSGKLATANSSAALLLQFSAAQELARRGQFVQAVELTRRIDGPGKAALLRPHLDGILNLARASSDKEQSATAATLIVQHFANWFSEDRRVDLFRTAAIAHAENKNYAAALQLADTLSAQNPDQGAHLHHRVEFLKRRAEARATESPIDIYKVAVWAREMGLLDEANTLLGSLASDPTMAENVRLQLQILELDRGKRELADIRKQYENGKYQEAQKALASFGGRYAASELQQKALELTELIRYREWTSTQRAPAQAEASYQHAERLYNQGKLAEALDSANKVIADYTNTPAGNKAAALRDKVEREIRALRGGNKRGQPAGNH